MKILDVIKIANIDKNDLSKEFLEALTFVTEEYTDNSLEEHLYSPDNLSDEMDSDLHGPELLSIKKLCDRFDCSYFRVITN